MAKIKHTKNELKAQRDSLARFERFLPMLILKKQQLQAEIHGITTAVEERIAREQKNRVSLNRWVSLLSEPVDLNSLIALQEIITEDGNIAGVSIPIFKEVRMKTSEPDLFATPAWVDDAMEMTETLIRLRTEREILEEQRRLIADELRITTQRVNLFEKVKIPECQENIRVIRIFLGDEQTAGVARAKIAKNRSDARKRMRND